MKSLLIRSFAVAAAALIMPPAFFILGLGFAARWLFPGMYLAVFVLTAIWAALLGRAWYLYGGRGLWVLVGAPLVLFWPAWMMLLFASCAMTSDCL